MSKTQFPKSINQVYTVAMQESLVNAPQLRALSRNRMYAAMGVAVAADIVQLALGPVGWMFFDEAVDVVAMMVVSRLIGFHWLLLPTFAVEFVPLVDMIPTWTASVLWVIRQRKKQQEQLQAVASGQERPPP